MTAPVDCAAPIGVGRINDAADYLELEELYREVFGIRDGSGSINARWLHALDRNSGIVVVARDSQRIVGFACSFLSRDRSTGRLYQYSQTAAVRSDAQGRGVGRALKQAQRAEALAVGVGLMRWTFDPMRARNAHFNFDVLGGRSRALFRDFYGDAAHGRDAGDRTDRLLVDWELTSTRPTAKVEYPSADLPAPGETRFEEGRAFVAVPLDWDTTRAELGLVSALRLRAAVAAELDRGFASGLAALSCVRTGPDTACYLLGVADDQTKREPR